MAETAIGRAPSFPARKAASSNGAPLRINALYYVRTRRSGPKPSLIIRTESNVRKEMKPIPDPPCVECKGSGKTECIDCHGRGRTNHLDVPLLPKGEWPKWCKTCGSTGYRYCNRCFGSGQLRGTMGIHFKFLEENQSKDTQASNAAENLINDDKVDAAAASQES